MRSKAKPERSLAVMRRARSAAIRLTVAGALLAAPTAAAGDEVDCNDPENASFCEWIEFQETLWAVMWAETYAHGTSVMTLIPPDDPAQSNVWTVQVWINLDLDYDQPFLDQNAVDDQIVAEGTLTFEEAYRLGEEGGSEVPYFSDTIVLDEEHAHSFTGTLHGSTGVSWPVVGVLRTFNVASESSDPYIVHAFGVLEVPEDVQEGSERAELLAERMEPDPDE